MSSLREKRYYPVLFMLILTIILTSILALFYEVSKERVASFRELSFKRELIGLFKSSVADLSKIDLSTMDVRQIDELYNKYISEVKSDDNAELSFYEFRDSDKLIGYCYPMDLSGLWGKIAILAAIDNAKKKIIGISITAQNETPGLGGRIAEEWFQKQFSGKVFRNENSFSEWKLVGEDIKPEVNELRQVSGATISSRAVSDGLIKELKRIYADKGEN